jgi:hypothetical protein
MKTKQAFLIIMLILLSVADLGTAFDTFPVRACLEKEKNEKNT